MLVISGPNGSGKTTLAERYAALFDYPYIGADKIAAELAPNNPASQRIEAGRRFTGDVAEAIQHQQSVVIESTLSGRTLVKTLHSARASEYSISIVHLLLDSADTCVARVRERVQKGGHDVPVEDIRRRFTRSAANFWELYRPLCDRWILLYNATSDAQPVAEGDAESHAVRDVELFESFLKIVASDV